MIDEFINNYNHYRAHHFHSAGHCMHKNSESIMSIIFDETNFTEDKFEMLKKELKEKHKYHEVIPKFPGKDIFCSLS